MPLFRRRSRDDEPVDPEARSPDTGLKYKDIAVIGQLMKAGADLAKPRHFLYYLYASSRERAEALANAARDGGFGVEVREPLPQYPGQWAVVCETNAVLTADFVRGNTDLFEGLAATHGAEYDGWEASV